MIQFVLVYGYYGGPSPQVVELPAVPRKGESVSTNHGDFIVSRVSNTCLQDSEINGISVYLEEVKL